MPVKKTRVVRDEQEPKKTKEMRAAPKRAGSTSKPADAGRYSTQLRKS
jgi:hypothetical protein